MLCAAFVCRGLVYNALTTNLEETLSMSEKKPHLDFDTVANLFVSLGVHQTPSEIHGLLTGKLAAGQRFDRSAWLIEAQQLLDTEANFTEDQQEQLYFFYMATATPLADADLAFEALIPDDDVEMELRLQTLGLWCSGFLAGFALVEKAIAELPELVNDALNDLAAIAQVGANDDEEWDASAEQDFFQLLEYVRLAAMNIYLEYQTQAAHQAAPNASANAPSKEGDYLTSQQMFKGRQVH